MAQPKFRIMPVPPKGNHKETKFRILPFPPRGKHRKKRKGERIVWVRKYMVPRRGYVVAVFVTKFANDGGIARYATRYVTIGQSGVRKAPPRRYTLPRVPRRRVFVNV